jgi:protein phosphatase
MVPMPIPAGPIQCYKCKKPFNLRVEPPLVEDVQEVPEGAAQGDTLDDDELMPSFDLPPEEVRTTAPSVPVGLEVGASTSVGMVRKRNEDSYLVRHLSWSNRDSFYEIALLVVADGMGGYDAGDVASGVLARALGIGLNSLFDDVTNGTLEDPTAPVVGERIDQAIREANKAVHRMGQTVPACKGMGATLAVVVVWNGEVRIGHVGDTRVYHCREGKLKQVTKDQTLVARMVELGTLTAEEALTHPNRNEVTQSIGRQSEVRPVPYQLTLAKGDWLVIACDGLHAHVDETTLRREVNLATSAPALARQLVDLANQGGGSDNCTVLVVHYA